MATINSARWHEISPHLDRALELSAAERATWLDEMRTSDPGLADDVQTLLEAHSAAAAEGFLKESPGWLRPEAALAGRRFGAYTVEALIGQGGMGSVWRARRSDDRFEGLAAIKLLNLALIGRKGAERFKREASILARLQHPNIARMFDAGVCETGQPYLVLEHVEGQRIDEYCDSRRLTIDARLRLFLDVLAAVEHAHSMLIVHRDLKPSNLLVTHAGVVKLLDFGIAKLLADQPAGDTSTELTHEETRVLTPDYAAPEQFLGASVTVGTDVYALGVLLFVLLCGRHPAGGRTRTPAEWMKTIVDTEAPRLSDSIASPSLSSSVASENALRRGTTPERLRRQLAGDIDNIVAKALKIDARERYESVTRLADDIRRYLNDEPVSARPDTLAYRAGKFVRRHRGGVATAALTVCALVVATAVTTWQMLDARAQRDEALYQTRRAQAVNDFMNVMMAEVGPDGRALTPLELLDKGRALLDWQYGGDPRFVAGILISIAGRYMDLGRIDKELETLEQAERVARARNDDELLASVQCNTVDTEVRLGRKDRALARMVEARRALARLRSVRTGLRVGCLYAEAYLAWTQGDLDAAIGRAREALQLLEGNDANAGLNYTMMLSTLAGLYADKGLLKESYEFNRRTIEAFDRTGRGGTMGRLIATHTEALNLLRFGEVRSAEALERSVIERMQGRDAAQWMAPEFASAYGTMLSLLARPDEALPWLRFGVTRAHADGNPLAEARANLRLAAAHIRVGDAADAARLLSDAARVLGRDLGNHRSQASELAETRAKLLLVQNRVDEAKREIDALIGSLGFPQAGPTWLLEQPLLAAAEIHLAAGEASAAESYARAALSSAQDAARDPKQSANVGRALLLVGEARFAQGDTAGAREAFERAHDPIAAALGDEHPLARELASKVAKLD